MIDHIDDESPSETEEAAAHEVAYLEFMEKRRVAIAESKSFLRSLLEDRERVTPKVK